MLLKRGAIVRAERRARPAQPVAVGGEDVGRLDDLIAPADLFHRNGRCLGGADRIGQAPKVRIEGVGDVAIRQRKCIARNRQRVHALDIAGQQRLADPAQHWRIPREPSDGVEACREGDDPCEGIAPWVGAHRPENAAEGRRHAHRYSPVSVPSAKSTSPMPPRPPP